MNIEHIASETANEMPFKAGISSLNPTAVYDFLRRCLSKLAEQAGEPVAVVDEVAIHWDGHPIFNGVGEVNPGQRLYTESQYIAAQQRTAEACAKVCENLPHKFRTEFSNVSSECAAAIRNNWREYL